MDGTITNELRTAPPRPLTDDERNLLRDWNRAAKGFYAFVSERQSDAPAIYRQIVVSRRSMKQDLYLIQPPKNSTYWIMHSCAKGEYIERFPTLRAALIYIEPVAFSSRAEESAGVDRIVQPQTAPAATGLLAKTFVRLVCYGCVLVATLVILWWLGSDNGTTDGNRRAEALAEAALQASLANPDGTQFRNVLAYRVGPENERWVCGWFSAKDAAGGLVGPRRFVVHVILMDQSSGGGSGSRTHLLMSETEVPGMSYVWDNYCR